MATNPRLEENLRAFALQDYPVCQFVLGVATADDRALPIARRVAASLPGSRYRDRRRRSARRANPKIANVLSMMRLAATHVLILAGRQRHARRSGVRPLRDGALARPGRRRGDLPLRRHSRRHVSSAKLGAMFMNEQFIPSVLVNRAFRAAALPRPDQRGSRQPSSPQSAASRRLRRISPTISCWGTTLRSRGLRVVDPALRRTNDGLRLESRGALEPRVALASDDSRACSRRATPACSSPIRCRSRCWRSCSCRGRDERWRSALRRSHASPSSAFPRARSASQPASAWMTLPRDLFGFAVWACGLGGNAVRWRDAQLHMETGDVLAERH